METIKFIKEHGVEALTDQLGIKVKDYPHLGVMVLNYCQIDSPKTHPVVMECRGLILDRKDYEVYCRPFTRFFNYGEAPDTVKDFSLATAIAYEKVDGSLIKIYRHPIHGWQCATRGTAQAESECNGFDITFRSLVFKALDCDDHWDFQKLCDKYLVRGRTYLFELTSMENRVVTRYEGTKLWFLGCVSNACGVTLYNSFEDIKGFGCHQIGEYEFDTFDACLETAAALPDLNEGYVVHDIVSDKRIKVKSPAYVAVHHIRGEGLNPKRIKQLVLTNEQDEYLKYFPEDAEYMRPVARNLEIMLSATAKAYNDYKDIDCQKEFAKKVGHLVVSHILFKARQKGLTTTEVWSTLTPQQKYKTFSAYLGD